MGKRIEDGRRHRARRLLVGGAVMLALALLAAGCGGSGGASSSASSAPQVVQVHRIGSDRWTYARARFREMCAGCHTLANAGTHGRRFNLDEEGGLSREFVRHVITSGEPGMPHWDTVLSRRELEELVAYISSVAKTTPDGREDGWHWQISLRIQSNVWNPGMVGRDNWAYARARFREMCASCHTLADAGAHGPRFDLDHAGKLEPRRVRQVILQGGPDMPRWDDVLSKRELEELVAYVSTVAQQQTGETGLQYTQRLRQEGQSWTPTSVR
jgi:mono/diheme cytochrome c family protein